MSNALWAALAAAAFLWPSRLAGPFDGAPLDQPTEAVAAVVLAWLLVAHTGFLRRPATRVLVAVLILWKVASGAVLAQDGWCLTFTSPVSLYRGDVFVPHSWDVRADWRSTVPACSAIMTEAYPVPERFPAWFFNLPPADPGRSATLDDRPPNVTTRLEIKGFVHAERPGVFRVAMGEDVHLRARVDSVAIDTAVLAAGITLAPGLHEVSMDGDLVKSQWSIAPTWDGASVWRGAVATVTPPLALDRLVRPWLRWLTPLLAGALLLIGVRFAAEAAGRGPVLATALVLAVMLAAVGWSGREPLMRFSLVVLAAGAIVRVPRRLQNMTGAVWLAGVPLLAMFLGWSVRQVGVVTWYSSGDDWWMFQRFAYRIYLQGYWLEGGELTFWFQPLYRWIAGALHMIFGDSSVGELYWDAGAALVGALFAFHVTRGVAGFRWGLAAAIVTVTIFTVGPTWYLFGRGLSEFTSAGFLYAAALFAMRARHGYWPAALAAGLLATLAFLTRLNNLPMALGVVLFALPPGLAAGALFRPQSWIRHAARPVAAGVLGALAIGLWLFTARTYYYTSVPSMLFGTSSGHNSVWQAGDTAAMAARRLIESVMMFLTMSDPPAFDPRALPLLTGFAVALLAAANVRRLRTLPLPLVGFCLTGISSALIARATSYPARFSVHLIPVTVALTMCALSLVSGRFQTSRFSPPARQSPGTT